MPYFHDSFILDTIGWIAFTLASVGVGYLLVKLAFQYHDHKAAKYGDEVIGPAWARFNAVDNKRKSIFSQWYTHQIDTKERDRQLNKIGAEHRDALNAWIRAGRYKQ